jgi:acyl-CoA synthetase (NDP forming)
VAVLPARIDALADAAREMESRLAGHGIEGFLVCEFVPHESGPGNEFLLGYRDTRDFGPVVTVGPGGVHAEFLAKALRDGEAFAAFSLALEREGAIEAALSRLSVVRLATEPQRGAPARLPLSALADVVRRLLALAKISAGGGLAEFEANPLVVSAGRLVALDALGRTAAPPPPLPAPRPLARVRNLLEPRSIAVMGVSEKMNPGRIILQNVLRAGFAPSAVTVIKPGAEAIDGCRCVPALADLSVPVDLLVLSVSAPQAAEAVAEAADRHLAESIVLIPGGLDEKPEAAPLVARMRESLARARATAWGGPVVNGGNCLGVWSRPGRYDTLFIPEYKLPRPPGAPSPLALITGSGAFAVAKGNKFSDLQPVYTITIGNQMDLTVTDHLEALEDDDRVEIFALYLEGFRPRDGERFLRVAERLRAGGKSVILYLAGRTAAGAAAASSHTASVAGDFAVARALARGAGVLVADSLDEFEDLVRLFTLLRDRRPAGWRLGALSNAGFEAVAIADALGPFRLAQWDERTAQSIAGTLARAKLAEIVTPRNPMDVTPLLGDEGNAEIFRAILADAAVDAGVFGCVPLTQALTTLAPGAGHDEDLARPGGIVSRLAALRRDSGKPFVAVVDAGALYDPLAVALEARGIPAFRTADRALRAFATWCAARLADGMPRPDRGGAAWRGTAAHDEA